MKTFGMVLGALLGLVAGLNAKSFEGVVRYKTLGPGSQRIMSFSIKDHRVRVDTEERGQAGVMIMDSAMGSALVLMPGQKKYMKMDFPEPKVAEPKQVFRRLKKTGKMASIAGFSAEEWAYEGEEQQTSFWGTQNLGGWSFNAPKGAPELALPRELRDGSFLLLKMKNEKGSGLEAVKVEAKKLDISIFQIPSGYQEAAMPAAMRDPRTRDKMKAAMQNMDPQQKAMMEKLIRSQKGQ